MRQLRQAGKLRRKQETVCWFYMEVSQIFNLCAKVQRGIGCVETTVLKKMKRKYRTKEARIMKTLRQILFLMVTAAIVFSASPAFASSLQEDVLYYVNIERQANGLQPLSYSSDLGRAAEIRANDASVLFAHRRPNGEDVKSVLNGASYSWFGENLAVSSVLDAQKIVRAWMGSPTHRANLLNHHFTQMGLSCVQGADGHYYWAQLLACE